MFTIVALHLRGPANDQSSEFVWRMKHSAYFRLTRSSSWIMSAPWTLSPHQIQDASIFSLFTYLTVHGSHIKLAWIMKASRVSFIFFSVCIIISFVHTFDVSPHHLFLFTAAFVHEINKGRVVRRSAVDTVGVRPQRSLLRRDRWLACVAARSRLLACSLMGDRLWEVNCRWRV